MPNDKFISVTVQSGRGSVDLEFPKQAKIKKVIDEAVAALGYPGDGKYILVRASTNEQLKPERTLVSYHIEDGEVLILSEDGSGV